MTSPNHPTLPPQYATTDSEKAVARKKHAKSGIIQGLDDAGATGSDIVIVTDLDEIPRAEAVVHRLAAAHPELDLERALQQANVTPLRFRKFTSLAGV